MIYIIYMGVVPCILRIRKGKLGCDIGGAKELGLIYFPTNWGAKEPYSLPNDRVENHFPLFVGHKDAAIWHERGCEAPRDFGGSKKIMGKSRGERTYRA